MPESNCGADGTPSTELLLAAIERAERHSGKDQPGVLLATVKQHLGLPHESWTTRRLRPKLDALEASGLVEQLRRPGLPLRTLTSVVRAQLDAIRDELPESPQHQAWREAQAAADERIGGFREGLRRAVDEVRVLLDDGERPSSDAWFEIGERLLHACRRLKSATYCLHEWSEPDDARADTAEPRGRRPRRHRGAARAWPAEHAAMGPGLTPPPTFESHARSAPSSPGWPGRMDHPRHSA